MESCCSCEEIRKIVEEEVARILTKTPGVRKKRAPSAYNIFIGECMKQGKPMAQCAFEYKKKKMK